jgi:hypothetical protein
MRARDGMMRLPRASSVAAWPTLPVAPERWAAALAFAAIGGLALLQLVAPYCLGPGAPASVEDVLLHLARNAF